MSWNFGLRLFRLRSSAELLRLVVIGAELAFSEGGAAAAEGLLLDEAACTDELMPDFGDDLAVTLNFLAEFGFLIAALSWLPETEGAFKSLTLRVLDEGDPLELLVEPTSRPTDLFKGLLLLLPTLARCWRPLLDILGVGVLTQQFRSETLTETKKKEI